MSRYIAYLYDMNPTPQPINEGIFNVKQRNNKLSKINDWHSMWRKKKHYTMIELLSDVRQENYKQIT